MPSAPSPPWPFVGRKATVVDVRALVADPETAAVVVTAPAGVGKTRLAREATARAVVPPLWLQAAPAVAAVPFGALADLADAGSDPAGTFQHLAARAADGGGVVVVDDAPHLDARSADLLHRLVRADKATVVATARADAVVPAWMEWLWLGDRTRHLALAPLGGEEVTELVATVLPGLDGPHRSAVVTALVRRTGGNALYLREMLTDLRRRRDRGLPLELDAGAPPHLLRVLEARLRASGEEVTAVLAAVAVLGSLPLAVLERTCGAPAVAEAEQRGLVVVEGTTARAAHPLHAEAAEAATTAVDRRRLTEQVALLVLDEASATATERLGATAALVDLGATVAVDHLVAGARAAFAALDHDLAVRLATAAVAGGDAFEAKVVLGAALSGAGRPDEAEQALREALAASGDDQARARAVGRLSVHLVAHGGRLDEAAGLLDEVDRGLVDPAARAFLAADRAKLASIRGDLTAVPTTPADEGDELAVLNGAIVGAYAQAMAGDAAACRATIAGALPLAERHRDVLPWSAELVRFSGTFAALVADGPVAAVEEATSGLAAALDGTEPTVGTWRFLRGFAIAVSGDLVAAVGDLAQAWADLEGHDLIGARPLAAAAHAWVAAQSGDVETARGRLDLAIDAGAGDGRVRTQVTVADAWCDGVEGGLPLPPTVTERVVDAAREASDGGQVVSAAIVLHEVVRLGGAKDAIEPLRRLAGTAPRSWFLDAVLARAEAEVASDDAALVRLVRRCEGRWPVVVAELHGVRHRAAAARGDAVTAGRAAVTARAAIDRLGGPAPWTLAAVRSPLTPREHEVAAAVAAGATNREVAARADVSVRTVENQLQSTYRKLGLDGRSELALLFGA